ncbi:MAG: hypothetical protein ACFFDK_05645 [Promethearchaeota archaeon]
MLMQGASDYVWLFWVIIFAYLTFLAVAGYHAKKRQKLWKTKI